MCCLVLLCQGASEVKVTLLDQSTYSAKVVGFDPDKDVAVLQLDMPEDSRAALQPVSLGSSTGLMVGQRVYAIGGWHRAVRDAVIASKLVL